MSEYDNYILHFFIKNQNLFHKNIYYIFHITNYKLLLLQYFSVCFCVDNFKFLIILFLFLRGNIQGD